MRSKFFLPNHRAYLLNHSVGALTQSAFEANQRFLKEWQESGSLAWPRWIGTLHGFRDAISDLLGVESSTLCPVTNLSTGLIKILSSLPKRRGRKKIIFSSGDFPSMGFVIQQTRRLGYEPCLVESGESFEGAIDKHTQAVFITHVRYGDSRELPVKSRVGLARQHKAYSIVDIAQSAGILPIPVTSWDPDFILGTSVKWLCGGPGAAFLYVKREKLAKLQPLETGWFGHRDPMAFDIHEFDYALDALRFLDGTPSIVPYAMAQASLYTLMEIGLERITQHNRALSHPIYQAFRSYCLCPEESPRGGTVTLDLGPKTRNIAEALLKEGFAIDHRPGYGLRISPHIYNLPQEIADLVESLERLITL